MSNDLRMRFSAPERRNWSISSCLITPLDGKIRQFETKVLEHTRLRPACQCLLTRPGVGVILALTIMLETGNIGRFPPVGDYTSYCRGVRATHSSNGKKKGSNNSRDGAPATKAVAGKWSKAACYIMKRQAAFALQRVFG
jgi:transposase